MLAVLGFATIVIFLAAIMSGRISVLVALVIVPLAAGVLANMMTGMDANLGAMMLDGVVKVAPVGIMITFALLYFGLMLDKGLFDPLIRAVLRLTKGDPVRICVATVVLTTLVALDGDGSTTFLITIAALRPIYDRLGMSRLVMAACIGLAAGIMNIIPWGGPTTRVMALLSADATQIFNPLLIPMAAGLLWSAGVAAFFGMRERKRLGLGPGAGLRMEDLPPLEAKSSMQLFWFNAVLTAALLAALIMAVLPLSVLFMIAFAIALIANCPKWDDQQKQLASHAGSVVAVTSMVFAAGIFTGILTGTKMIEAMSTATLSIVPENLAGLLPVMVAITSMPLSLAITADAYYFGVLPILTESAATLGLDPLQLGRAAVLGHMTTGFPVSPLVAATFVLVGRSGVSLGEHQRFLFPWAFGSTVVMTAVAYLIGVI